MLGNAIKVFSDPGALVKDAVNSLLPKELSVVGSIAGAVVDFQTGRPFQGAQHAFQALKDLPQALNAGSANTTRCGSPEFEPSPPPLRQNGPSWRGTAAGPLPKPTNGVETAKPQTSGLSGFMSMLDKALKLLTSALGGQAAPAATTAAKPKSEITTEETDTSTKSTSTKPKDTDDSSSTKSSSTKKSSSTTKSETKKTETTTMAKLDKMSDGDFMDAVRNGKIPDDVLKDPKAMMQIQARMNQISEMTKLMTSMMQALHDMQMSIIQNVRV
jgi:hypothetical protein